jgi:peroxiredoxin
MPALAVGAQAPDFELKGTANRTIRLSEVLKQGKAVVLAFFPAAWSPTCGDEMTLFQEVQGEIARLGAQMLGISVDNVWTLDAWAEFKGLTFPLLSDFHPQGAVGEQYGIRMENGTNGRALFVVDAGGALRYSYLSPPAKNPGVDGVLEALEKMRAGK